MERKTIVVSAAVLVLVLIAAGVYAASNRPVNQNSTTSNAEESAVRNTVTEFGTKLQTVSLLAPAPELKDAMDLNYGSYVAPELLATWEHGSASALGRQTSSPWPDHIEIVEIRPQGERFVVEGNVIETASAQTLNGTDVAAVYPVTLTLEKRGGRWLIIDAKKGAYSELPQSRSLTGTWECLPHKDTTGPQTMECALGIALEGSGAHYGVDTSLMGTYPVDFPTGTKVRATGLVTPVDQLSSVQRYNIDGVIRATSVEKL